MLCAFPVPVGGRKVSCGRCMPCRVRARKQRTARYLLEAWSCSAPGGLYAPGAFCTLTYRPEMVEYVSSEVDGVPLGNLVPHHLWMFIRRVRRLHGPGLRFAAVGEYGDESWRPHYHVLFFNADCERATRYCRRAWERDEDGQPWYGHARVREMTIERCQYVAGYVAKKLTSAHDEALEGRRPEFMRQSLKPPVGVTERVLGKLTRLHETGGGAKLMAETRDVARTVFMYGRYWPLDKTVRKHLRRELGVPEKDPDRPDAVPEYSVVELEEAQQWHEKQRKRQSERRKSL